jgi:membrane protein DedA with SNARE-associated domain
MASVVQDLLAGVPAWVVYVFVFLLPFLEASILLGFVFPGETALIFGGVLASQGQARLSVLLILAILGAVAGDGVGYAVGRRYGSTLQLSRLGQIVGPVRWKVTEEFLHRRGGPAVFFGRFTALLRALVPGVAGMAGIHYRTFAIWNLLGGAVWATGCVIGGYAIGDVIGRYIADVGYVLIGLVVVVGLVYAIHRHYRPESGKER